MNENFDVATFEFLIHILEVSVVVGIGVIIYITKRYSKNINEDIDRRMEHEVDLSSEE